MYAELVYVVFQALRSGRCVCVCIDNHSFDPSTYPSPQSASLLRHVTSKGPKMLKVRDMFVGSGAAGSIFQFGFCSFFCSFSQ